MVARRWVIVVLLGALSSLAAQYRTKNFIVEATTPEIAKHIGEWAEYHRKQKAIEWLGTEMPTWGQPCPLKVKVSYNGSGGATSFAFDRGRILSMEMQIEGTLERLTYSVLPHEVTHTVLAFHFRCPVPRWADEGGSVLSEDDQERTRHDTLVRQILATPGRMIPLRRLFALTQYPRDVMVLYAEGYSVTNYLVGRSSRQEFLNFISDGMRSGWDQALMTHYQIRSVDELEQIWLQHLRETRRPAATMVASASGSTTPTQASPASRVVVRQTLPPAIPILGAPRPIARGVSAEETPATRAEEAGASQATPFPAPPSDLRSQTPAVKLGMPRPASPGSWNRPAPTPGPTTPAPGSPVGFSP
ncbi:MAG: hypothetical protein U0840_07905 [Gemmataceae bacterium]